MATRTYLSRLAQPLTAADPVVWSTPHAEVDEARPPVESPSRSLQRAPLAQPSAMVTGPGRTADALGAVPVPAMAANAAPTPPPTGRDAAPGALPPFNATAPALRSDVPRPGATPVASTVTLYRNSSPSEPGRLGRAPVTIEAHAQASGATIASPGKSDLASRSEPGASQGKPAATSHSLTDGPAAQTVDFLREPERVHREQRHPSAPLPTKADPPQLHIGAIEIRVSPPPPAPAAPVALAVAPAAPAPSAPLSRSYTSRFGLAQG